MARARELFYGTFALLPPLSTCSSQISPPSLTSYSLFPSRYLSQPSRFFRSVTRQRKGAARGASSALIRVGVKEQTSATRYTTSATISPAQKEYKSDTPEHMASKRFTPEEIPHASTWTLPELEALLGQQEECSRITLESALAKKQEAERLIAQASRAEGDAKSLHFRYEQTEAAIRALRTLVAEKNGQTLEGQFEDTNRSRALAKRSSVRTAPN